MDDGERGDEQDEGDELYARMSDLVPLWRTLGFKLISVSKERAVFEGEYRHELSQGNVLHGGVLAALIDSACAGAALAYTYPDAFVTSIALQVTYLRPVTAGRLRAVGRCVRVGGRVVFGEAEVFDAQGELVGRGAGQMLRVPLPAQSPWQTPSRET